MAMESASKNRAACRSWYERLKKDPLKHRARIDRISDNRRKRKARASQASAQSVKQSAPVSHPSGPTARPPRAPHVTGAPGRFEAPVKPTLHQSYEPAWKRAVAALDEFLIDADVANLDEELGYGERAALMEFDGGLARADAEIKAALNSTWAARSVSPPGRRGGFTATPSGGGKHASTVAQGKDGLTADRIIKMWRYHWGIESRTE